MERRKELAANLATVRNRITAACHTVGRSPSEVTLVVVTKLWPASDIRLLAELGVSDVGESRNQEATAKATQCADLGLTWHFVGQLQVNKCNSVATYADVVHSVDRLRLVTALSKAAERAERRLTCLIQVSVDGDPARGGVPITAFTPLADAVVAARGLRLGGVMAVAPPGGDPAAAFDLLAIVAAQLQGIYFYATAISAGMSMDLESAISAGATHVRIGTAVLGLRPPLG